MDRRAEINNMAKKCGIWADQMHFRTHLPALDPESGEKPENRDEDMLVVELGELPELVVGSLCVRDKVFLVPGPDELV